MGCCSKKKSTKKTLKGGPKKGGANASNKSKKGGKPAPGAKGKPGGAKLTSTSSKRTPNVLFPCKTPAAKGGPGAKPGARGAPSLQRAPADKRPVKTPATASSSKSAKSGPSSASGKGKKNLSSSEARSPNPTDARQAKKRENHAKSLGKAGIKGRQDSPTSDVTTARSPPYDPKKASKEKGAAPKNYPKIPEAPSPPPPRDPKKKQDSKEKAADKSTKSTKSTRSQSRASSTTGAARASTSRAPRPRRVSRSKLPMQKLTVSSHIEDGIVVSQWYYTELRELGTPPSSVADLLQGGPRQQLNLPQSQPS